ncbi:SAM-dependent methyltransferase [Sphingobium nicotianae]|uniref:Cyclopropane-fatty-acyl-phospholipid synthase family protein n=1 Tax=Sphingobium nicotianae TaxID=2782607 RepID=A0A9X1DB91_9SPHN|nr:cyclopropane-fatty-acyl-phospholipid synthase family protein [Sphingobium nicotianae]MBT2186588.1 cyclopropane-fatty-acyl-phospholipid synthase family protein [Sphingobium nicotianae]
MTSELNATKAVIGELARHLNVDICLELWDGSIIPLGANAQEQIRFAITSPSAMRRLLREPSLITVAELYAAGDLDIVGGDPIDAMRHVDHLQFRFLPGKVNKMRLLKAALPILAKSYSVPSLVKRFTKKVGLAPSSGRDDRELIGFHYDLSNAFYELFLDENMVYSSAYFPTPESSLDEAQLTKLDLICRKLRLQPGDRLFDPGCGWGGLLCHAAQHYGVQAYGTTLSQEQYDYTSAKVARLGLGDQVTLELRDCRSLPDDRIFDKIAQVEMVEHVGIANHHEFYRYLRRHMRERGVYFGQASFRRNTENPADFPKLTPYMKFIVEYIFPGGELDHIGMTCGALERAGFEVHEVEAVREHFGYTTEHWARRLYARREEGAALVGMPQTRLWLLYLSLCALSFHRGALNAFQVVATSRYVGPSGVAFDRRTEYLGAKRV